jgi:hypothetical protein
MSTGEQVVAKEQAPKKKADIIREYIATGKYSNVGHQALADLINKEVEGADIKSGDIYAIRRRATPTNGTAQPAEKPPEPEPETVDLSISEAIRLLRKAAQRLGKADAHELLDMMG